MLVVVSLQRLGHVLVKLYGVIVFGLSVGLFLYSETWCGKIVILASSFIALFPLAGVYWIKSRQALLSLLWGAFIVLNLIFVVTSAPDGKSRPESRVANRFAGGDWPFPRYSLANLIPEIEQIKLGIALVPYVDPLIDRTQARRIADVTLPIYRQMERDPDFRRLGSVMGWAYEDHFLLFSQPDAVLNTVQKWLGAID